MWLSRQRVDGTLYVDGIEVDSGKASGSPTYINSLERFFLGGVPEEFDAKRVPVSRIAVSLFDTPCLSLDLITGGTNPVGWGCT